MFDDPVLTIEEVARELRCSKAHVCNAIRGKIRGVSLLQAIAMGRRKLIRRSTFEAWKRQNEQGNGTIPPSSEPAPLTH